MESKNSPKGDKDPNYDIEEFFRLIGQFIKHLRIQAGFPTPESFANTIDMPRSQYSAYESGKNMELTTFKRILLEFDIKVEDWLNLDLLGGKNSLHKQIKRMREARISQVISQVKKSDMTGDAEKLSVKAAQRYIEILIHCHIPRSRSYILEDIVKLEDSSYNTFKRIAGKLIDYGWLDYTNKESKNSPAQAYYTTEKGKKVLRLGNE